MSAIYVPQVLNIAVLSILLTAPLGSVLIAISGPLTLNKTEPGQNSDNQSSKNEHLIETGEQASSPVNVPSIQETT